MRVINLRQAEASLPRLVKAIERGLEQEIVIVCNGQPAARLVPVDAAQSRKRIGVAKGKFVVPESTDSADKEVVQLFVGKVQQP